MVDSGYIIGPCIVLVALLLLAWSSFHRRRKRRPDPVLPRETPEDFLRDLRDVSGDQGIDDMVNLWTGKVPTSPIRARTVAEVPTPAFSPGDIVRIKRQEPHLPNVAVVLRSEADPDPARGYNYELSGFADGRSLFYPEWRLELHESKGAYFKPGELLSSDGST